MRLLTAVPEDAPRVAALHFEVLPASVSDLTPLGRPVVERFYRNAIQRDLGAVFVVEDEGRFVAMLLATEHVQRLMKGALIGTASDVVFLLTHVNPFTLARAVLRQGPAVGLEQHSPAEIVYLGVDERHRGGGCAMSLMRKAIEHLRSRGVAAIQAHVDLDNEPAIRFNAAMGFELLPEPTGPGGRRRTMVRRLRDR